MKLLSRETREFGERETNWAEGGFEQSHSSKGTWQGPELEVSARACIPSSRLGIPGKSCTAPDDLSPGSPEVLKSWLQTLLIPHSDIPSARNAGLWLPLVFLPFLKPLHRIPLSAFPSPSPRPGWSIPHFLLLRSQLCFPHPGAPLLVGCSPAPPSQFYPKNCLYCPPHLLQALPRSLCLAFDS